MSTRLESTISDKSRHWGVVSMRLCQSLRGLISVDWHRLNGPCDPPELRVWAVPRVDIEGSVIVLGHWLQGATNVSNPVSSQSSGGSTARDSVEQYLNNNRGWHEVAEIRDAIGYSHDHTLKTCKRLRDADVIEGEKNWSKTIIGYWIKGNVHVPGNDVQQLIDIIRTHGTPPFPNVNSMSISELQDHIRYNIADSVAVLGAKWEFRKPSV